MPEVLDRFEGSHHHCSGIFAKRGIHVLGPVRAIQRSYADIERVRASPEELDDINIPDSSKDFLAFIGLPRNPVCPIRLELSFELIEPALLKSLVKLPAFLSMPREIRKIGYDYEFPICVCADGSGHVVLLHHSVGRMRYVNSLIEHLGGLLALYEQLGDTELVLSREDFELSARAADPCAFQDDEGFWSLICEQMRDGII